MKRRLEQIEESIARYLHQMDSADRQEPSPAGATKTTRLKDKIVKLKEEMQRLEKLDLQMLRHQTSRSRSPIQTRAQWRQAGGAPVSSATTFKQLSIPNII